MTEPRSGVVNVRGWNSTTSNFGKTSQTGGQYQKQQHLLYSLPGILVIDGTKMSSTGSIDYPNQYIPNISNIYNMNVNMILETQTKCDNMFSDPELYHIFSHFSVTYLVYVMFLLVCYNYPLTSKRGRCINIL